LVLLDKSVHAVPVAKGKGQYAYIYEVRLLSVDRATGEVTNMAKWMETPELQCNTVNIWNRR